MSPAAPVLKHRANVNDLAMRALLDLDPDQPIPSWAVDVEAGPSRRAAASRIPQPAEIVRMLLALADRTLSTPKIRANIDSTSGEAEERRRHFNGVRRENNAWELKKKKLAEARVRCNSAAETKANKETVSSPHV